MNKDLLAATPTPTPATPERLSPEFHSSLLMKPDMRRNLKTDEDDENQNREEADRLALLPIDDHREIIALHRSVANGPKVPKREREAGLARAKALERLLGLNRREEKL